jgi:sec-independent protein translocase protein TatA
MFDGLFMPSHLILLGLIAVLLFGAKRLPGLGRQLGTGLRSFRDSSSEYGLHELTELRDSVGSELREVVTEARPAESEGETSRSKN